jgi:hypothetical protein
MAHWAAALESAANKSGGIHTDINTPVAIDRPVILNMVVNMRSSIQDIRELAKEEPRGR